MYVGVYLHGLDITYPNLSSWLVSKRGKVGDRTKVVVEEGEVGWV